MSLQRPRLLIVIVTVLFIAATVRLGIWQLGRGQHKAELAAQMAERDQLPARPWQGELGESAWLRRYTVQGVWQAQGQIFLDNRVEQGRAGFHVLAPLQLPDGHLLLINRGWMPKQQGLSPVAALPAGPIRLTVRLYPPEQHYVALAPEQVAGSVWQNLDWSQYRQQVKGTLLPALAYQLDGEDGLVRRWPAPDAGVEKHYAYAGQWFLFAALAAALFVILHWKRSRS